METHLEPPRPKDLSADRARAALATSHEILVSANHTDDIRRFLNHALPQVMAACQADGVAVPVLSSASRDGENWTNLGQVGRIDTLTRAILASALDAERLVFHEGWVVAPLDCRGAHPELLAVHARTLALAELEPVIEILLPALREGLIAIRARQRQEVRISRLEAILEIVGRWNQTQEVEDLLVQMAEAATRLVEADRASIFLWDRAAHQLVGRPALGVGNNELRIADNAGVVGRVIATGVPQRLGLSDDPTAVNRQVDSSIGYQTRTLLCVPLRGRDGDLFGAFEVINKREGDFSDEDELALVELATHAGIALENTQERESLLESRRQITDEAAAGVQLIGQSAVMEALRSTIRRVAPTELAVLLLGENGTGKEVVSQSIHYQSPRRHHPFIAVNCAALTETLLENELFGHEKGAFTDAGETRPGKFELASSGTLFLDEIGDLSLAGQAKLLRVLEEKIVVHVGGSKNIHTDVRVIAATNQDLTDLVRQKKFREDLYFRLNVVTLVLPPLRERPADIMPLAEFFLRDFSRHAHRKVPKLAASARHRLESHPWPGNVRELRNLCERLAYLHSTDKVEADDLAFVLSPAAARPTLIAAELPLAEATDLFQVEHIQQAVRRAAGNMSEAADMLGLHRSNLYRKMRQLGMPSE